MTALQKAFYQSRFEIHFLRAKADEFQTFFERLMGLAYKADFLACRPWGQHGDRKNDGFLKSEKRLFQVYAPNSMSSQAAITKITEDFDGAKVHWGALFSQWTFVHNAVDGLPPHVIQLLLDFEQRNPGIKIEPWGLEELRVVFNQLTLQDLEGWLGYAPTEQSKAALGFKDLQPILLSLATKAYPAQVAIKDVPPGKIQANDLSESVALLLKNGMSKTPLVLQFFNSWHDETLGDNLATAFRDEYARLKQESLPPNQIFSELQAWVGGNVRGSAEHEMAVLTLLAYYFERCDIFEEPRRSNP